MQIPWMKFIAVTISLSIAFLVAIQPMMPTNEVFAQAPGVTCKVAPGLEGAKLAITHRQSNEEGTHVQRRINGGAWQDLTTLPAKTVSFTDSSLTQSTTQDTVYEYQIRDFNKDGATPWSNIGCKIISRLKDPPLLAPILEVL